jgi:hypothetical protein
MCGAASPTKPINPVNEITIDVIKADKIRISLLVVDGSTPDEIAKSSPPSESVFKSHAHLMADGIRQIIAADAHMTSERLGLERLP